jgi:hypothetical protein
MTIIKYAGSRILADDFNGISPLSAIRAGTQSVTSSTTLVNDDTLSLSLDADATYVVLMALNYSGAATGSGDMKFAFSPPSGATMNGTIHRNTTSALASVNNYSSFTGATACGTNGSGTPVGVDALMIITTSSAGTLQLQWAQNTSSGTATVMGVGSSLVAWRIA